RFLAELPGERLLFVPVDEAGARRLERERRFLSALAPRVSFAVPLPLDAGPLDVRRRVAGETGMQFHWSTIEDPLRAEAFADDLARILAELHSALSIVEITALDEEAGVESYPLPVEKLRPLVATLPEEIRDRLESALDRYAALDEADPVLSHGDVGTHNLVF